LNQVTEKKTEIKNSAFWNSFVDIRIVDLEAIHDIRRSRDIISIDDPKKPTMLDGIQQSRYRIIKKRLN